MIFNDIYFKDFWTFAITSTLMIVFFPWSLLICVIFFGMDNTKIILKAMFNDVFRTLIAVLTIIAILAAIVFLLLMIFA